MSEKRTNFQQKTRVLNKLFPFVVKTEKEMQKLTLDNIIEIEIDYPWHNHI